MREQLLTFIKYIKSDDSRVNSFDEAATKQELILQPLSFLGWNVFNSEEVYPEYSVGKDRVDYSLRIGGVDKVFLEAKKVKEDLQRHQKQLLNYSFQQGIELAILTNGVTWWFYLPLRAGDWEQRKFYSIDIHQQEAEDIASKFVDFLARENIASGKAFDAAETIYKSQQRRKILQEALPKAWNIIISKPDELLRDLINETAESICGYRADDGMVEGFLSRHKDQLSISVDTSVASVPFPQLQVSKARRKRSASPETRTYKLLKLFFDIGGEGTRSQINEQVPNYWELRSEEKKIEVGTRNPKYWHNVASFCQSLKSRYGYLENPKRGTWRLTEKGRNYLKSALPVPEDKLRSGAILQASFSTLTSISENYTGKKISSFYFGDQKYEAESWRELLLGLCSVLKTTQGDDFDDVLEMKGRKHPRFTRDMNQLLDPKKVPHTDIFVETNLSANSITRLCRRLIALFGYSDDDLKIELKEE